MTDHEQATTTLPTCDACARPSRDIRSVGRDYNGDPDGPDLCFVCRKEEARGRTFNRATGRYEVVLDMMEPGW